jgi:membrane protease YdiL (CAAX protease family)
MPLSSLLRFSLVGYPLLFVISLALASRQGRLVELFRFSGWAGTVGNFTIGVVLAGLVLLAGRALRWRFAWARQLEEEFRSLLSPLRFHHSLVLAALSGLAEETFFRAVLQPVWGLWVTSILFGLLHYPMNRRMVPWTVIATAIGFVFGIVYQTTDSLLAVALAHGLINFFELLDIAGEAEPDSAEMGDGTD